MTALSKDRPLERAAYRASDEAWSKAVRIARELDRVLDGDLPMREAVSRAAVELRHKGLVGTLRDRLGETAGPGPASSSREPDLAALLPDGLQDARLHVSRV